jgi:hypothetical protein
VPTGSSMRDAFVDGIEQFVSVLAPMEAGQ